MPRWRKQFTKATHQKRLKEGRGQGDGAHYLPYIYVQDFSSRGQSNRDFGLTTGRQHDLFSKLEHRVYLVFDNSGIQDIKEQYPLPLELTLEIAKQIGVRHPTDRSTKEPIPVTTDLLLTIPLPISSKLIARSVKYTKDFADRRVVEKLELERRAWLHLNTNWGIITERNINPVLTNNLLWSYKCRHIDSLYPLSPADLRQGSKVLTQAVLAVDSPLCDVALRCDHLLSFPRGTCLRMARHLIASRQWRIDMTAPIVTTKRLILLHAALSAN